MLYFMGILPIQYRSDVERLYHEYKNVMLYTARGIVREQEQAEDIVHMAFLRIIKHIERINTLPDKEKKGYIIYVVKNLSIDHLRKKKRSNTVSLDNIAFASEDKEVLEDNVMAALEIETVKRLMRELDDMYALPLILKYTVGYSYAEISDMLDITVENAKVRCFRGRKKLVESIRKEACGES